MGLPAQDAGCLNAFEVETGLRQRSSRLMPFTCKKRSHFVDGQVEAAADGCCIGGGGAPLAHIRPQPRQPPHHLCSSSSGALDKKL